LRYREFSKKDNSIVSLGKNEIWNRSTGTKVYDGPAGPTGSLSPGETQKTWDETHGKPPYYTGGPFFSLRTLEGTKPSGVCRVSTGIRNGPLGGFIGPFDQYEIIYIGNFISDPISYGTQSIPGMSITHPDQHDANVNPDDLSSVGNRAWSKLRPKVEIGTVFQDVYELKDVPGMLHTTSKGFHDIWKSIGGGSSGSLKFFKENYRMFPKKTGDHYLNVQFGWKPFVQSINNVLDVVVNFSDHVAKLEKQNDRWMQRTFHEPSVSSSDVVYSVAGLNNNGCTPAMTNYSYVADYSGTQTLFRDKLVEIWYSGSFKFYREEFDTGLQSGYPTVRSIRQMTTLLGAEINPVNLYKVMPWSWLVDWFANVGDGIQRFQDMATGSVAARYMYLCRHSVDSLRYNTKWSDRVGTPFEFNFTKLAETKLRVGSQDPFNFALVPGGLSPGQLRILAALGLSRLP